MTVRRMTVEDLTEYAFSTCTDEQRSVLDRMQKFGWKVTKVTGRRGEPASISLGCRDQAVRLKPDGTVVRPDHGKNRARIRI